MIVIHRIDHEPLVRLQGNSLRDAQLVGADLRDADLAGAVMWRACLEGACLEGARLEGADLRRADLYCADLTGADLRRARLEGADLRRASLKGADLTGASLEGTRLEYADLTGASLTGTCLDPEARLREVTNVELEADGLELDWDHVIGWRTARSWLTGAVYRVGERYTAPVFSCSRDECHPGLYLGGRESVVCEHPHEELVKVRVARRDLHRAGDKWRCRAFTVIQRVEMIQ